MTSFLSYMAYRPNNGHFIVKNGHFWLIHKKNWTISLPILQIIENETTFFSPTFKVEENSMTSFMSYMAYRPRYGHFLVKNGHFGDSPKRRPYLDLYCTNIKSDTTFCPTMFTVEKNKATLLLSYMDFRPRFGIFCGATHQNWDNFLFSNF